MGCPPGNPGPVGLFFHRGFFVNSVASGTSISHFTFDGTGFSDTNLDPLAIGIQAQFVTNNVTVEFNTFLGGGGDIEAPGSGWLVAHNVFKGFTILPSNGFGGFAIASEEFQVGRFTGNVYTLNEIKTVVPARKLLSIQLA
jgi:hypothetical protein